MSSFSLKNNLTIDNNKYFNWLNYSGHTRYNIIGLNTSDNLIISPPNNIYIQNGTNGNYTFINNLKITDTLTSNTDINISKNKFISTKYTNGSSDGFIGLSSSDTTSGSSRVILYGSNHSFYPGNTHIYSGNNTSSSINFYNGTSNSLAISNNIVSLYNVTQFSDTTATIGNIILFNNTTNSTSATTGCMLVNGGIGIKGNLSIDGSILYNNTTSSTNVTTGSFVLSGGLSISNTDIATSVSSGGAVSIAGGIAIGQNALLGGNAVLYNNSSTNSTSSFNANLVVYGGAGINDAVYLRTDNSQINIAPVNNDNPTSILFYKNNNFLGNYWKVGRSDGNFVITTESNTNGILVLTTAGNVSINGNCKSGTGTLGPFVMLQTQFIDINVNDYSGYTSSNTILFTEPGNPGINGAIGNVNGFGNGTLSDGSNDSMSWNYARLVMRGSSLYTATSSSNILLTSFIVNSSSGNMYTQANFTVSDSGSNNGYSTWISPWISTTTLNTIQSIGVKAVAITTGSSTTGYVRVGPTYLQFKN